MIIKQLKEKLCQLREAIYQSIEYRADAIMELLDAISSNSSAKSVVELSLNPVYQRQYSSIEKSISEFSVSSITTDEKEQRLKLEESHLAIISKNIPQLQQGRFHLFASDVTPQPRPFAPTLSDRKVVHSPNPTLSNKPIAVGHEYSHLVYLPEKPSTLSPPWVLPLSVRRVSSAENGVMVAASQITALMTNPQIPFANELCLHVGDGAYSSVSYIHANTQHDNLVVAARLRSNRKLYFQPQALSTTDKGHPFWYGKALKLRNANRYRASQEINTTYISRSGVTFNVRVKAWDNLLMRGKKDCPMHDQPLTLIRIDAFKSNGKSYYRRPLFLIVAGKRRAEISIVDIWLAYAQRYDIEHYFRFGKQNLLMSSFQTPDSQHEENWWHITLLAYCQLYLAAPLACHLPRPWEAKSLSSSSSSLLSPSAVQRDFARIIKEIGSPAKSPKSRGISLGRLSGTKLLPRKPLKIVFKSKKHLIDSTSLF
jgi:DDE superfamily endonuclease